MITRLLSIAVPAMMLLAPSAQAVRAGAVSSTKSHSSIQVAAISHGVKLSLSLPHRVYPAHDLVRVTAGQERLTTDDADDARGIVRQTGYALLRRATGRFQGKEKTQFTTSLPAQPDLHWHVVHIPSSNLILTAPASWRYYPAGGSGSHEILYGFLSSVPFRHPCGTFAVQGRKADTCKRPLKRISPDGIVIEIDGETVPVYWNQLPASAHLHIAGHPARAGRVPVTGKHLPWFCPLNTDEVMVGVIALSRRIAYPGRFDTFSACLIGPDLTSLEHRFLAMFRSVRLTV